MFYSAASILDFIKQDQYYNYHPPAKKKEFLCSPVVRACASTTEGMGDTGSTPGAGNKIKSCMLCSATYI